MSLDFGASRKHVRGSSDLHTPHPPSPLPAQISIGGALVLVVRVLVRSSADSVLLDAALEGHALGSSAIVVRCRGRGGVVRVGLFVPRRGLQGGFVGVCCCGERPGALGIDFSLLEVAPQQEKFFAQGEEGLFGGSEAKDERRALVSVYGGWGLRKESLMRPDCRLQGAFG